MQYINQCVRCGKDRVIQNVRQEMNGTNTVTYTAMICPDSSCQEKVDKENAAKQAIRLQAEQRAQARHQKNHN